MSKVRIDRIREMLGAAGRLIAFCPIDGAREAVAEIEGLRLSGEIAPQVYERYMASFVPGLAAMPPGARSLILIALPVGRTVIELEAGGERLEAIVPPTYGARGHAAETEMLLDGFRTREGSAFARARVPNKILAARSGLGCYGRDSVLRFGRAGSFVRLDAWWTDIEPEGESWGEPHALERCASCGACARACPRACIAAAGTYSVDAAACLTYMNEGSEPFPVSLDPRSHNAAVGCLRCQDACPANAEAKGRVDRRIRLDAEASRLVLAGEPVDRLPPEAAEAVMAADMDGSEGDFARNLLAFAAALSL